MESPLSTQTGISSITPPSTSLGHHAPVNVEGDNIDPDKYPALKLTSASAIDLSALIITPWSCQHSIVQDIQTKVFPLLTQDAHAGKYRKQLIAWADMLQRRETEFKTDDTQALKSLQLTWSTNNKAKSANLPGICVPKIDLKPAAFIAEARQALQKVILNNGNASAMQIVKEVMVKSKESLLLIQCGLIDESGDLSKVGKQIEVKPWKYQCTVEKVNGKPLKDLGKKYSLNFVSNHLKAIVEIEWDIIKHLHASLNAMQQ